MITDTRQRLDTHLKNNCVLSTGYKIASTDFMFFDVVAKWTDEQKSIAPKIRESEASHWRAAVGFLHLTVRGWAFHAS